MKILSDRIYNQLVDYVKDKIGIVYSHNKKEAFVYKIDCIMRKYNIKDYDVLLENVILERGDVYQEFINSVTTNKTDFFREMEHFDFIFKNKEFILENNNSIEENREIRIWSAACSSGEEPYTLAMVFKELFGNAYDIKILATDINTSVLQKGQKGIYKKQLAQYIPVQFLQKYCTKKEDFYYINQEIKRLVFFRSFNLMNEFSFKHNFDIVFCRNVMIYFNSTTQYELIRKINRVMNKGGLFFVGHSETLQSKTLNFKSLQPSIYIKN